MNRKLGMGASLFTFFAVLGFAVCMIIGHISGSDNGNFISSVCISLGYIPLVCAYVSFAKKETKAAAFSALGFAIVYGTLIAIVYFTQLTTVRLAPLSEQATMLLDYSKFGLFFSLDLLGYAFMSLSTFFIALTLDVKDKAEKALKILLLLHGIFAISCFIIPTLGVFKADMAGGDLIGTLVLEFWCVYFMPICLLSYRYFKNYNNLRTQG